MRKIILVSFWSLLLIILSNNVKSQFILKAMVDTIPTDTVHRCINQTLDLNSSGSANFLMNNNFNNSTVGTGWDLNVTALWSNPCPPITLPAQGVVLWIGQNAYPRFLTTVAYDLSQSGCIVEWDMKYGGNQNSTNCESPDEPDEGVYLKYSINNGATWVNFPGTEISPSGTYGSPGYINGSGGYWTPVSGNAATGPYYTWNHYKNNIPPGAMSTNTKIRWFQDVPTSNVYDHWGVDNVQITCPTNPFVQWECLEIPTWSYSDFNPPPFTCSQPGTYHFVVTLVDLNTGNSVSDTVVAIVHNPSININSGASNVAICIGDTTTLFSYGTGLSNYNWNTNPVIYNDSAIVNPTVTTSYIVTAQDNFNCIIKDTISVIVNSLPVITTTNGGACGGDTATLSASGGVTYLWENGETTSTIKVTPSATTTYGVTVVSAEGCKDTSSAVATIFPKPVIQLTDNTTICMGDSATLTASGGTYYLWSTTETTPSIKVSPTTLTSYTVAVTDDNGCFDSKSVDVDAIPLPTPLILQEVDTICKGTSTTLIASGGSNYLWNTGETSSTILIAPYLSSFYSVTVSNSLNNVTCSATANTKMNVRNCNMIYIPNSFAPFGYNTIFKPSGEIKGVRNYSFQIFNRWGQLIYETNDPEKGWDGRLNGEYVPAGAYVYYLKFENVDDKFEKIGSVTVIF